VVRAAALAAFVAAALAAGAASAQQTEITFRFNDAEAPQMREALDVFEKENPGVKVDLRRISWADAQQQYLREAAVGAGPDVSQLAFVWPRSFGAAGALLPLDEDIKKTGIGVKGWQDFVARDLATGADGKVYAIPWTTDTFAMVYNKDLFAQAGLGGFPKTWEGLRAASKAIFQKTGKSGWAFPAGACGTPTIWFLLNFYWWGHGWALVDKAADGKFFMHITPQQIAEGLRYYRQYLSDGDDPKSMLGICLWGAPEVVEGMVDGSIAIACVPDTVAVQIVAEYKKRFPGKKLPYGSATVPAGPAGSITFRGGRMLGINPNSKHPEADWQLIRFLTRPDPTFTKYYTNYVPAQRSLLGYTQLPPELQGFSEQIKTARSWGPYSTGPVPIPFMWNLVGRAAGSAFIGDKTAEEAAAQIHDAIAAKIAGGGK
jgi:multiple sugar transport system substrate-binding protein